MNVHTPSNVVFGLFAKSCPSFEDVMREDTRATAQQRTATWATTQENLSLGLWLTPGKSPGCLVTSFGFLVIGNLAAAMGCSPRYGSGAATWLPARAGALRGKRKQLLVPLHGLPPNGADPALSDSVYNGYPQKGNHIVKA